MDKVTRWAVLWAAEGLAAMAAAEVQAGEEVLEVLVRLALQGRPEVLEVLEVLQGPMEMAAMAAASFLSMQKQSQVWLAGL